MQPFSIQPFPRKSLRKVSRYPQSGISFYSGLLPPGKMTSTWLLIVIISLCYADCKAKSTCDKKIAISYLDTAVSMVSKVNSNFLEGSAESLTCPENIAAHSLNIAVEKIREAITAVSGSNSCKENITGENIITRRAQDCSELLQMGYNTSGVYTIWPANRVSEDKSLKVYCDMQTKGGGWTVIQRRGNFQNNVDYFYKDWKSYKEGFGDIEKEFWLGNDNIYALTNQRIYSVRFDLKDVESTTRYAEYGTFRIEDENHQYTLHIAEYSGDAGDVSQYYDGKKFSTKDQANYDDKNRNCAEYYRGGWWYKLCGDSSLNGLYLKGKHNSHAEGVNWYPFKGNYESLESTEIKIRPKYIK